MCVSDPKQRIFKPCIVKQSVNYVTDCTHYTTLLDTASWVRSSCEENFSGRGNFPLELTRILTPPFPLKALSDESISRGLACAHIHSIVRRRNVTTSIVVFLSCPPVKEHAGLLGTFLYSQSTMKDMYSKPTNRTELSIPMKTKSLV